MHFWMTWFPFWSCTHLSTWPSNSDTRARSRCTPITSSAFWITRQPYICCVAGRGRGCGSSQISQPAKDHPIIPISS